MHLSTSHNNTKRNTTSRQKSFMRGVIGNSGKRRRKQSTKTRTYTQPATMAHREPYATVEGRMRDSRARHSRTHTHTPSSYISHVRANLESDRSSRAIERATRYRAPWIAELRTSCALQRTRRIRSHTKAQGSAIAAARVPSERPPTLNMSSVLTRFRSHKSIHPSRRRALPSGVVLQRSRKHDMRNRRTVRMRERMKKQTRVE